jgi:hypothetical protein
MEESYVININTGDAGGANGSVDAFRNALVAAGNTWSNAGAAFSFKYGGSSGAVSTGYDNQNLIHWENMGDSTTLAEATWWKYDSGQLVETDIRFNDYYAWDVTGSPAGNEPDLQSVATHELGHWLSLGHDTDGGCPASGPVMCASYNMGTVKRTLSGNDIAGIKAIYGSASQPTPTRTATPRPTYTPTRTATPRPTYTPTRTPTPRPTLSPRQIKSRAFLPRAGR